MFLDKILKAVGFGDHFQKLIMWYISTTSLLILLNGNPLPSIKAGRGLQQGDPLYPYLFFLCGEVFSRSLSTVEESSGLFRFQVPMSSPLVSHLMFVEYTFPFTRASVNQAEILLKCLKTYSEWSGQKIIFFPCRVWRSLVIWTATCQRNY